MNVDRIIFLHRRYVKEPSLKHLTVFANVLLEELKNESQPVVPVLLKTLTPAEQAITAAVADKGLYTKAQVTNFFAKVKAKAYRSEAAVKELSKLAQEEGIEL